MIEQKRHNNILNFFCIYQGKDDRLWNVFSGNMYSRKLFSLTWATKHLVLPRECSSPTTVYDWPKNVITIFYFFHIRQRRHTVEFVQRQHVLMWIVFSLTWAADPEVGVRHSAVKWEVPDEEGVGRDAEHAAGHPVLCVLQVAQVGPPPRAAL